MNRLGLIFVGAALALATSCIVRYPHVGTSLDTAGLRERASLLGDPDRRDRAACDLFAAGQYRRRSTYKEERCERVRGAVNHVIKVPQQDGSSVYMVFRHADWLSKKEAGPGRAKGPFALIDNDGLLIPVFHTANVLDDWEDVIAYAGDDRRAVVHVIQQGPGRDGPADWTAQTLNVVPVTPEQRSALSLVLGPPLERPDDPCAGFSWGWRSRDLDGDGVPAIEIGPFTQTLDIATRATYRWFATEGRYEGPAGSVAEGFLRLDLLPQDGYRAFYKSVEQFVQQRSALALPPEPNVGHRSRCITDDTKEMTVVVY